MASRITVSSSTEQLHIAVDNIMANSANNRFFFIIFTFKAMDVTTQLLAKQA
ncbi:MAG: hypothetical protein NC127_00460 [Muribaculum sp.]|nr:hypothetical protein [Muribaculum sp.]